MRIVDAGMVAFSAWFAVRKRLDWPLTYQVPRMVRALVRQHPGPLVLCWNAERLWKRELFPPYRDREEIWQVAGEADFDAMFRLLGHLGVVQVRADGREADEAIAALAHRFAGSRDVVLHSDDKDFMQLLSGRTWMEGRVRGTVRWSDVKRILGVTPAYVVDLLALAGDKADGIPRVVRPKTAKWLIAHRGHVCDWIDRTLRVEPALRERLDAGREQLRTNLRLVDLSAEAVGPPPPAVCEGFGDLERARRIGEATDIGWLQRDDLADEVDEMRRWGERTLDVLRDAGVGVEPT